MKITPILDLQSSRFVPKSFSERTLESIKVNFTKSENGTWDESIYQCYLVELQNILEAHNPIKNIKAISEPTYNWLMKHHAETHYMITIRKAGTSWFSMHTLEDMFGIITPPIDTASIEDCRLEFINAMTKLCEANLPVSKEDGSVIEWIVEPSIEFDLTGTNGEFVGYDFETPNMTISTSNSTNEEHYLAYFDQVIAPLFERTSPTKSPINRSSKDMMEGLTLDDEDNGLPNDDLLAGF